MSNYFKDYDNLPEIRVTMYLYPLLFENSKIVLGSVSYNKSKRQYHTDVNPYRVINGPFTEWGNELEPPIKDEYESFLDDCRWLINEVGFTILKQYRSTESKKSEYIVVFGIGDKPCGSIVYELRISDHPLDVSFPEDIKDEVLELLKMNKVLDGSATKAGIDFAVEKVTVGVVINDTWDKAFNRLHTKLKQMKNSISKRNNSRNRKDS